MSPFEILYGPNSNLSRNLFENEIETKIHPLGFYSKEDIDKRSEEVERNLEVIASEIDKQRKDRNNKLNKKRVKLEFQKLCRSQVEPCSTKKTLNDSISFSKGLG